MSYFSKADEARLKKLLLDAELSTGTFTAEDETKLDGIQAGAEVNPAVVPQAEAEAGTATTERIWTAQRVAQAIAAQSDSGLVAAYWMG